MENNMGIKVTKRDQITGQMIVSYRHLDIEGVSKALLAGSFKNLDGITEKCPKIVSEWIDKLTLIRNKKE